MASTTPHTLPEVSGPTHPVYDTFRHVWLQLCHVAEGSGGFLDGSYLIAHPREWVDHDKDTPSVPTKKLKERRTLARYENFADLILRMKLAGLFREPALRRCLDAAGNVAETPHAYLEWTANVDGAGTSLTAWLKAQMTSALIFGHQVLVMDRTGDDGPTHADRAPLTLKAYAPLDVPDWLQASNKALLAVKVVEPVPRESLAVSPTEHALQYRTIEIDAEQARSYVGTSRANASLAAHGFGVLPVVVLYAHRRPTLPLIGLSALSDPMLFIDIYNLTSELRELLRKQTFSMINVQIGTKGDGGLAVDAQEAASLMGTVTGTSNVLMTPGPAQMLSADTDNVSVYRAEIEALLRIIFRLAAIPYDQDSRDAESAEAKRLKRQDYTTVLSGYADELTQAELAIARLWFRGTYGEAWMTEWERAGLQVQYPNTFDDPDPTALLELAQAALSLPLGESKTFRMEHSTRMLPTFLPDANPALQGIIRAELEAVPSPEEQRQDRMDAMAARMAAGRGPVTTGEAA